METYTVWEKRYASLNQAMNDLYNLLEASTTVTFPQKETLPTLQTLQYLINRLLQFSVRQFYFFYDGFGQHTMYRLEQKAEYPPQYAFSLTLDQVAFDFEVIQRAAFQRIAGNDRARSTLEKADQLARLALQPALDAKLIQTALPVPAVVTYFQKSMSIRFVPYASVALIGIPLSCMYDPIDYLAIPHEMGHYVYRHDWASNRTIEKKISAKIQGIPNCPDFIKKWQEEIFADIYGCIIGGPVAALDFQDQQLETPGDDKLEEGFQKNDGEHPIPLLRPYIYSDALGKLAVLSPKYPAHSMEMLEQNWKDALDSRDIAVAPDKTITTKGGASLDITPMTGQKMSADDARSFLSKAVGALLLPQEPLTSIKPSKTWSWDLPDPWQVAGLYDQFTHHVDDLIAQPGLSARPDPAIWPPFTWEDWAKQFNMPAAGKEMQIGKLDAAAPDGWIHVLKANGWVTKWPHTRD